MAGAVYEQAKALRDAGYSVIPVEPGGKIPAVPWKEFQERIASEQELQGWFLKAGRNFNLGIVTGRVSNLCVVDVDPRNGGEPVFEGKPLGGCTVVTGGGGWHFYYSMPELPIRTGPSKEKGIDLKGDGGFVVCPPSRTTGNYTWGPGSGDGVPHCPPVRRAWEFRVESRDERPEGLFTGSGNSVGGFLPLSAPAVSRGGRNNEATKLLGRLLYEGVPPDRAYSILRMWNSELPEPLSEWELGTVIRSITERHQKRLRGSTQ